MVFYLVARKLINFEFDSIDLIFKVNAMIVAVILSSEEKKLNN